MSDGPIANYTYSPWMNKPGTKLGFSAVGPGWTTILESLDELMVNTIEHAVQHGTVVKEKYREAGNTADAKIVVGQIKEKFGGLRVYIDSMEGISDRLQERIHGAVNMAEYMAYKTCEKCGSMDGVDTRNKKDTKAGRTLTLCGVCHEERDNLPPDQWFEFGNGDKTV